MTKKEFINKLNILHRKEYNASDQDDPKNIDKIMDSLIALAKNGSNIKTKFNMSIKREVSAYTRLYDIYSKADTVDYLVGSIQQAYKVYSGKAQSDPEVLGTEDTSIDQRLKGYAQALSDVLSDHTNRYFFITLDDDNVDDAVYGLNAGTLDGIFSDIDENLNIKFDEAA